LIELSFLEKFDSVNYTDDAYPNGEDNPSCGEGNSVMCAENAEQKN